MTSKKYFYILIIMVFIGSLSGCAIHRDFYPYYDSTQEVYEQNTNPTLWQKVADLEKQSQTRKEADAALNSKMASLQESLHKVNMSLDAMQAQLQQLNAGLPTVSSMVQQGDGSVNKGLVVTLKDEMADVQKRLRKLEEESRSARNEIEKGQSSTNMPSIVVVSGTGKRAAAKKMALHLSKLGYRVDRISETPQNGYNNNVVFYAEPNREAAAKLAARIGGRTIVKPMDWQSKYGIAVISAMK